MDKEETDFIQPDKLIRWKRWIEAPESSDRYRSQALWLYSVMVITLPCHGREYGFKSRYSRLYVSVM